MALHHLAPAKVNLTLQITGKRPDGYHELCSLVAFAGVGDLLTITPAEELSLEVSGFFAGALSGETDNLVLRAARALKEAAGLDRGAHIHLEKRLPLAAGIGGGSSDAAATLLGLCRLWDMAPPFEDLARLALSLGADVPVCLAGKACVMSGIGETLTPTGDLPQLSLVLVNPMVPLATGPVFAARKGPFSRPLRWTGREAGLPALLACLQQAGNDLQAPARALSPRIDDCLAALAGTEGCRFAAMSGSGASCFGLFEAEAEAAAAAAQIARGHPGWWVASAPLISDCGRDLAPDPAASPTIHFPRA